MLGAGFCPRLPLLLLLLLVPRQLEEQAQDWLQLAVDDVIALYVIHDHAHRPQVGQTEVQILHLRNTQSKVGVNIFSWKISVLVT